MTTTDLIIPIKVETKELFTTIGVDTILKAVDNEITKFDITSTETKKDRDKIVSFAAKITKTKTFLEKTGKEFVAEKKAALKVFDLSRKLLRESLAEKAAQVREPVTNFEEAEKIRIQKEREFEIYLIEWDEAIFEDDLFNREREMERKEAELARQEEEKRQKEEAKHLEKERIENESRIRKEAEEKAQREAEEAIQFEKDEKERIIRESKEAEEQAKKDKIDLEYRISLDKEQAKVDQAIAIQKAKDDAEAKAKSERIAEQNRIAEEKEVADRKAANTRHQKHVNNKVKSGLIAIGLDETIAKKTVIAIAKGEIEFLKILY